MAAEQNWEAFFKDNKFVNNYKTGENITGQFAYSLLEQSGLLNTVNINQGKPLVVFDNACGTGGFNAEPGWDPVTGLGVPKYDALLEIFGV